MESVTVVTVVKKKRVRNMEKQKLYNIAHREKYNIVRADMQKEVKESIYDSAKFMGITSKREALRAAADIFMLHVRLAKWYKEHEAKQVAS